MKNKSYVFNGDFEQFILSDKTDYHYVSSKANEEFEYFILICEDIPLYTQKNYTNEYLEKLKSLFNKEINITHNREGITPWCGDISIDKKIISKRTSAQLNIDKFKFSDINLNAKLLKNNHLYIQAGNLSGRGHFLYPKDKIKIEKMFASDTPLIEEPLRERVLDFSTLFYEKDDYIIYENFVDKNFQYKGTVFTHFEFPQLEQYKKDILTIHDYYIELGISYPFSIDSFLYLEKNERKLKSLSEVNARKTMGWIANYLKNFFKEDYCLFYLSRDELDLNFEFKQLHQLNPKGNIFNSYFIILNNQEELNELRLRLF